MFQLLGLKKSCWDIAVADPPAQMLSVHPARRNCCLKPWIPREIGGVADPWHVHHASLHAEASLACPAPLWPSQIRSCSAERFKNYSSIREDSDRTGPSGNCWEGKCLVRKRKVLIGTWCQNAFQRFMDKAHPDRTDSPGMARGIVTELESSWESNQKGSWASRPWIGVKKAKQVTTCPESQVLQLGEMRHVSIFLLNISCGSTCKPNKSCYFQDNMTFQVLQQEFLGFFPL